MTVGIRRLPVDARRSLSFVGTGATMLPFNHGESRSGNYLGNWPLEGNGIRPTLTWTNSRYSRHRQTEVSFGT